MTTITNTVSGGYGGVGFHIYIYDWVGFNVDARCHFVRFDVHHERSGWEFGFGLFIAWKRWRPLEQEQP